MWKASDVPYLRGKRPLVMAHRGRSAFTPESSLLAFKEAYDIGVDVLETDIRLTKDNHPVVFHDETLDRTTNGQGKVSDYTLEKLLELDLGYRYKDKETNSYSFRNKGMQIVSLDVFFEKFPKVKVNMDIKDETKQAPSILYNTIKENNAENRTLVGSFHTKQIHRFRELNVISSIPTSASPREVISFLSNLWIFSKKKFCALQVPLTYSIITIVSKKSIRRAHKNEIAVHPWTINDKTLMKYLLSWEVDGIFTDDPELLIEIIRSTN